MAGREKDCRWVWPVGSSMASESRGLSAGVVCRVKFGEWVKRPVGGVWSVGSSLLRGSKELSASVVCRVKFGEWVKRIVGGVWSVGAKSLRGSKELAAECGLSGRKGRVGQRNCRQSLVCRGEKGEWVKRIVGGVWSVGTSL